MEQITNKDKCNKAFQYKSLPKLDIEKIYSIQQKELLGYPSSRLVSRNTQRQFKEFKSEIDDSQKLREEVQPKARMKKLFLNVDLAKLNQEDKNTIPGRNKINQVLRSHREMRNVLKLHEDLQTKKDSYLSQPNAFQSETPDFPITLRNQRDFEEQTIKRVQERNRQKMEEQLQFDIKSRSIQECEQDKYQAKTVESSILNHKLNPAVETKFNKEIQDKKKHKMTNFLSKLYNKKQSKDYSDRNQSYFNKVTSITHEINKVQKATESRQRIDSLIQIAQGLEPSFKRKIFEQRKPSIKEAKQRNFF